MNEIAMVVERDGVPITTSKAVADQFGKQHKNVLQTIENTMADLKNTPEGKEFVRLNFQPISCMDNMNREQPMYLLTRQAFTLLVMGFTGAKALKFKVAYINAFDRMEALLKGGGLSSAALQGVERRLEALEGEAGAGGNAVQDAIADTFLKAVQAALDSGKYCIAKKYEQYPEPQSGEVIGVIDTHTHIITLKSSSAYELYKKATKNPVSLPMLLQLLQRAGVILKRQKRDGKARGVFYNQGHRAAGITLAKRDALNQPGKEGSHDRI